MTICDCVMFCEQRVRCARKVADVKQQRAKGRVHHSVRGGANAPKDPACDPMAEEFGHYRAFTPFNIDGEALYVYGELRD